MERRRYCDPVLIGPDRAVLPLERVPFDQRLIDEGWLQELLRARPKVLPVKLGRLDSLCHAESD